MPGLIRHSNQPSTPFREILSNQVQFTGAPFRVPSTPFREILHVKDKVISVYEIKPSTPFREIHGKFLGKEGGNNRGFAPSTPFREIRCCWTSRTWRLIEG